MVLSSSPTIDSGGVRSHHFVENRRAVLNPGDLVWVGPETGLYPAGDDYDADADVPFTDDWSLAMIIATDQVIAAAGQYNWFLVLINDTLHYIERSCMMTFDNVPSSVLSRQR